MSGLVKELEYISNKRPGLDFPINDEVQTNQVIMAKALLVLINR